MTRMNQADRARHFHTLHTPDRPLILYNIWDAGSARAVASAGAAAIATGSWSVAGAKGYEDGQALPLSLLLTVAERICASVDLPVTIDFEGGYAVAPDDVAANVTRLLEVGAVGINFEDQIVGGSGLHDVAEQAARIAAIRAAAERVGVPLFINARTDLFLQAGADVAHADLLDEALERSRAYAAAGASGFFAPGLTDGAAIVALCSKCSLPVNVMMRDGSVDAGQLDSWGASRVSQGPGPYVRMLDQLQEVAAKNI